MSEKVRIGLISKLMRMSPEAIRFYEKKKIISPKRIEDSTYREYSMSDIKKLYDCKKLRNINFSIKEVDHIMEEASLQENKEALQRKKEELQRNIQEQLVMIDQIDRSLLAESTYEKYKQTYTLLPDINYAFYPYSIEDQLNLELVQSGIYEQVMDHPNLFSCTAFFDLSNQTKLPEFGFSVETLLAEEKGIFTQPPVKRVKSQLNVYTVIKTDAIIQMQDILPMLEWCSEKGYQHKQMLVARLIGAFYDHGREERYYEIYLPIVQF
ncbi:hypothetical protein NRIC_33870 [Enterococcus florum]|uniref:HTH merR-type domain-containing protein n=1 Tax=Enterococcus florum TaxID=2480627 RepID=A0A4P5PCF3_9ENTE|nr:MerR family transcriptional regulator [Enterococcus florum]GCF95496.1 hypothetical protein NRIC_33870 [Enterococcus florum]